MRSLRIKLIAPFILGTLALTLFLTWYTFNSSYKAVEDAMMLISEAKTSHATSSMNLLFRSMFSNAQNMVVDPHVTSLFTDKLHGAPLNNSTADWLEIITNGNEYYRDILIVNASGICIASSNRGHKGRSYKNEPYVQQALGGRFNAEEFSVGKVTKRLNAVIAGPIDVEGEIVGALVLMITFPKIVDYDSGAKHDNQVIFTAMLAPDGLFMAHKNKALMGNDEQLFPDLYEQLATVGEQGGMVSYSLQGNRYIGYAAIDPTSKWGVLTSGIEEEIFASAYRDGIFVFLINLFFLCIISLIVIRLANGILGSLLSLINYAKHVSEGDFDLQLADTKRKDELGILHTSLQRLVQNLQTMVKETQQASKMKGEFLANMSHEIRTPLNAIIGITHLFRRTQSLPEKQRGYLDRIQVAAISLLGLINDILDLSKIESGMLEVEAVPFNLHETLENTLLIHQENACTKGLTLTLEFDPDMPMNFIGDPLRIGQVLNNLIGNAIKFTPIGSVTVSCKLEEKNKQDIPCPHPLNTQYAWIRISVHDTGIGIAPEKIAALFQPFTQADASTSRQFGGTGLGLTISDKIVQLFHGHFEVNSVPGTGTTFSFIVLLPVDMNIQSDSNKLLFSEEPFAQFNLTGRKILIAEDNAVNRFILEELLEPSKATLVIAKNGQEAVDIVQNQEIDLILMDMQMPIMDGIEATRKIRAFADKDTLPIIAVTANAMKEDRAKGFSEGMNDYITKPIDPKQLLDVLRLWFNC